MKKAIIILLLVCYLIPVTGMTVSTHYCGGKIASVSLQFSQTEKCSCGSKKMKKDCCKTKTCSISLKVVQQFTPQLVINFSNYFSFHPAMLHANDTSIIFTDVDAGSYNKHHPPSSLKQPLYLSNRVFRI